MTREVQIGLAETADISSKFWKFAIPNKRISLPLTQRVQLAKAKGYEVYEAALGWSTVNELQNPFKEIDKSRLKDVVNVHPGAVEDRRVWPHPADIDGSTGWILRNATSLMIATPFTEANLFAAEKISRLTGASVGIHWPFIEGMTFDREHQGRRAILQHKLDDLNVPLTVHDHPLLGLANKELGQWLDQDKSRRFAFVSGPDKRDVEYEGVAKDLPHVNKRDYYGKTRLVFIKEGYSKPQLRTDLKSVLKAKQGSGETTFVMANFPGAGTAKTADELHKIVESI